MKTEIRRMMLKSFLVLLLPLFPIHLRAQTPSPHVPDANSIALYHFDETSAGTVQSGTADFANAANSSYNGKGYDIGTGQIVLGSGGVFGKSLQLNGASASPAKRNAVSTLSLSSSGAYAGGSFTVEAWIKDPYLTGASATQGRVIAQARDSVITWSFGLKSNGGMIAMGNATNGTFSGGTSALSWLSDTWYYVAMTADTTGQAEGIALYTFYRMELGGTSLNIIDHFVGAAPVNPGTSGFTVGGYTSAGTTSFGGYIDEVHYSNIARSYGYLSAAAIPEPSVYALLLFSVGLFARKMHRRVRAA